MKHVDRTVDADPDQDRNREEVRHVQVDTDGGGEADRPEQADRQDGHRDQDRPPPSEVDAHQDQHEDQDSTDFEKALHVVIAHGGCDRVYVLGEAAGVDGRLDHLFATLCVLVAFQHRLRILVVSDKCALQMVSEPTDGALRSAHALQAIPGCHCGLVPIGRPCRAVTTRGLEYDMDETPMAYKDIDAVMAAQEELVDVVHTLRQVVCVKG